jgi:hypothetical protein
MLNRFDLNLLAALDASAREKRRESVLQVALLSRARGSSRS